MVTYKIDDPPVLSKAQLNELEEAEKMPIVYDEDSPKLTDEMLEAFREERKKKPYHDDAIAKRAAV